MSIKGALKELGILVPNNQLAPQQKGVSSSNFFNFFSPTAMPKMGEKEMLRAYRGWVYACTNAIAERLSDIELKFQEKTDEGWQDYQGNSEAMDLLRWVNDFMSFSELVFNYAAFQELNGNSFWYVSYNGAGKPTELWPIDPTRMDVAKDNKNFIAGYVFTNDRQEKVPLKREEVVHFKRFNPLNPYRGMGTVEAAGISIDIDTYASEWQRNFFGNSAMPSGALVLPYNAETGRGGTLTQEQYDRLRANWDAKYRGVQNSSKLAILEGGLTWVDFTPNAREMQFAESRKDIRDEILGIFRVPKPILGILEDVNLASADAATRLFAENNIKTKMRRFVDTLTEVYLPLFGVDTTKYRFWFTDPVPENQTQKLAFAQTMSTTGNLTKNEIRAIFGYEPLEGGDTLYIPSLMQPVTGSDQEDDPAKAEEDKEEEGNAEDADNNKQVKKNFKKLKLNKKAAKKADEYKQEQIKLLHETYLKLNDDLKSLLLKRLGEYKAIVPQVTKEPPSFITRLLRELHKDTGTNELVRFLFENYDDWLGLVYNATKDGLTRILQQAGKDTLAELNLETVFDLQNPRALDWLNEHAMEDSKGYADNIKEDISLKVQEGVEQGLTNEDIADSISGWFGDQSDWRAMRIARSETINAYARGNLTGYYQSGVVSGKYWICDDQACDICQENADAGVIDLDDTFPSGDDCPENHPNGECSLGGATSEDA